MLKLFVLFVVLALMSARGLRHQAAADFIICPKVFRKMPAC